MPPFLPRKRLRSPSPEAGFSNPLPKIKGKGTSISTPPRKPTLFDDLDAGTNSKSSAEHSKAVLEKLAASVDDESSLSSLSEEEFEDDPTAKRQKTNDTSDEEDEDIEFEDVDTNAAPALSGPPPSGDLELTLRKDTRVSLTNPFGNKKGPSKIERGIRIATHQMHVQFLMWHNAIRNGWLCDKELQDILVKQLPPNVQKGVEKWRSDSGLQYAHETPKTKEKGKGKAKANTSNPRSQRDWGQPAEKLEMGQVDMSHGDPLFKLLKLLMSYWKQRFRITAPGLRKLGYMSLERLDAETKSFNTDEHDPELHGEQIRDIQEFKKCARALEGSRDVGAQLFTALLRGIGLEARMVANLQPVGFGWNQNEEASEKNPRKLKKRLEVIDGDDSSEDDDEDTENEPPNSSKKGKGKASTKSSNPRTKKNEQLPSDSDDESVVDITPAKQRVQPSKPYDKDLLFPHYWTEVLSPVTNTYTPVDPVVLHIVATNAETLEKFETRGGKSEKAKQITAYIVGHSPDGTAKDVTTRYLKRHVWPGRTKGNRLPVEKMPVYNHKGKVKRYEEYDWFKTVMSGYVRGSRKCPRTEIDDFEEATILKPVRAEKKVVEEGKETLQYYKSSSEYVLERHMRREEALLPTAKHVKMFTIKSKGESSVEEKVFLRKDVVNCKTMETWHKEGRAPKVGEVPLKRVPYRAATTNRRRELAEAEQASGEKVLQGLYSLDQTDWIIPPPIENGIIPKNQFGNIDLYVDSMLPEGAVHIPRRNTVKICKKLGIDYAEAVTGFEFGHRMAVPVITGVVIAEEHLEAVVEEWEKDEAERERKEDEKRTKAAIGMWRKFLMGLRIVERVREEYGDDAVDEVDDFNPFANKKGKVVQDLEAQRRIMQQKDEDMAGGFLPEGHHEEEVEPHHSSSFFPVVDDDEDDEGGGFVVEGHEGPLKLTVGQAYATPQSLDTAKGAAFPHSDEDKEMEDVESAAPAPKKRGRPSGSATKSKATSAAKKSPVKRTPASKRKPQIEDSEQEDDLSSSAISELDIQSDSETEEMPKKKGRKVIERKLKESPVTRKTPSRHAKSKSEGTPLRSRYFVHSDDEDE
jgi:xeroderma pigmentosum group C-complementing protein